MSERIFNIGNEVRNINNGKEYYITEVEKVHNMDSGKEIPTGYIECRPNRLEDNLPDYNRFSIDDLELID